VNARDEQGFTLIELLIGSVILGIIISSIAAALILALNTTDSIGTRLSQSHDAQLFAAWLGADATSAGPPHGAIYTRTGTGADGTISSTGCGLSPDPVNDQLRLTWQDYSTASGATYSALYRVSGGDLIRYFCTNNAVTTTVNVARNVQTVSQVAVTSVAATGQRVIKVQITDVVSGQTYQFAVAGVGRKTTVVGS